MGSRISYGALMGRLGLPPPFCTIDRHKSSLLTRSSSSCSPFQPLGSIRRTHSSPLKIFPSIPWRRLTSRKEAHAYYVLIVTAMYVFIMSRRVGQPYRYRIGYVLMWGYRVCKHALREESPFLRYVACLGRETC